MELEKREFERKDTEFGMRVYTSLKKGAYTVNVTDVSQGGAFIQSQHMPSLGEVISFEMFDEYFKPVHMGNAKVCRLNDKSAKAEQGFGVMFYDKLESEILTTL